MKKKLFYVSTITILICLFSLWSRDATNLQVSYLDVGQGDSILITLPNDFQILIDGGPDSLVLERLREEMSIGDQYIDWVIVSHSDADHLAGLVDVVENYKVGQVIMQDFQNHTHLYNGWLDILKDQKIPLIRFSGSQTLQLSKDIQISFFQHEEEKWGVNNASLLSRIVFEDISFFFPGDIEEKAESYYVENDFDLESTVLKVGHHGSKTSSINEFLDQVNPQLAIIQVGKDNKFNHPNNRVLYRLEKRGIEYWRNDEEGSIKMETDGRSVWIRKPRFSSFPEIFGEKLEKVYNIAD